MNILVIGAGYVGMALINHLQHHEHQIFATTTTEEKLPILKEIATESFIFKGKENDKLKKGIDLADIMIILVAPKESESAQATYLETAETLTTLLKGRTKPLYLLYTSSTGVYEGCTTTLEEEPLDPPSERAKILLKAEEIYLSSQNELITPCILRLGGIHGPGRELSWRAKHLSNKQLPGTGDEPTNHIHLEDILSALEFSWTHKLSGIFNLVCDAHPTRKELYNHLCEKHSLLPPSWNPLLKVSHGCGIPVSNNKIKSTGYLFRSNEL